MMTQDLDMLVSHGMDSSKNESPGTIDTANRYDQGDIKDIRKSTIPNDMHLSPGSKPKPSGLENSIMASMLISPTMTPTEKKQMQRMTTNFLERENKMLEKRKKSSLKMTESQDKDTATATYHGENPTATNALLQASVATGWTSATESTNTVLKPSLNRRLSNNRQLIKTV